MEFKPKSNPGRPKFEQKNTPTKVWQALMTASKKRNVTSKRDYNKEQITRTLNKWK